MNPYQPSLTKATVDQRMEERLTAAAEYRLARAADHRARKDRTGAWRNAVGRRLIAVGKRVTDLGYRVSAIQPGSANV